MIEDTHAQRVPSVMKVESMTPSMIPQKQISKAAKTELSEDLNESV